ncbi:MAG: GWxTD domain-containing protein [Candidatus Marinimicrobia bacterium]|nr:GWxTD domain-containing protein [Candidatus Neomarinimicrobiota bacterium]
MKYKIVIMIILVSTILNGFFFDKDKKERPKFNLQCYVKPGESIKKGILEIKIEIPYKELLFIKDVEKYKTRFDISINISSKGKQIINKNWIETIDTKNFQITKSATKRISIEREFSVVPKLYTVSVAITDLSAQNTWKKEKKVNMNILNTKQWVQSELYLYERNENEKGKIFVAFTALGTANKQSFRYYIYQVGNDSPIKKGIYKIALTKKRREYILPLDIKKFKHAKYKMVLITKINGVKFSRSVEFQVNYRNISMSITNIDDASKQLQYLLMTNFISRKDYKEIINAKTEQKRELFLRFWKSVDPTPRTDENELMNEYYHRIELANKSFSSHNNGWKTDRGMVLTIFGRPDDVEDHSVEMSTKPYIIWYYNRINKQFVFVDYGGFGSFELSQPLFDFAY